MAQYWALSSGNWSNVSNWLTGISPGEMAGSLPGPLDDVYANGRIITVDTTARVALVSNTQTVNTSGGGSFFLNSGVTLSAGFLAGANQTYLINFSAVAPNQATIVGNLSTSVDAFTPGIVNVGNTAGFTGTLNIRGSVIPLNIGPPPQIIGNRRPYISLDYGGTINLFGNIRSGIIAQGTLGNAAQGISIGASTVPSFGLGTPVLNMVGNLYGSSTDLNSPACQLTYGVVNLTGDVIGTPSVPNLYVGAAGLSLLHQACTANIVGDVFEMGIRNMNNATTFGFSTSASSIVNIRGNVIGGGLYNVNQGQPQIEDWHGCAIVNRGILNITGNVVGSNRQAGITILHTAINTFPSIINVYGNVFGGQGSNALTIWNRTDVTSIAPSVRSLRCITIYGDVVGGEGFRARAIYNGPGSASVRSCDLRVFGTARGGPGDGSDGIITVGGNTNPATHSYVYVQKVTGSSLGTYANTIFLPVSSERINSMSSALNNPSLSLQCYYSEIETGLNNDFPLNNYRSQDGNNLGTTGVYFLSATKDTKVTFRTDTGQVVTMVLLCANSNFNPRPQDVRLGTEYEIVNGVPIEEDPFVPGRSRRIGSCAIPEVQNVAVGTPVDNTVGTATFENPEKIWDVTIPEFMDVNLNPLVWNDVATRESNVLRWTYGERARYVSTINSLTALTKSLNNQKR